jgi:hypothetical protein
MLVKWSGLRLAKVTTVTVRKKLTHSSGGDCSRFSLVLPRLARIVLSRSRGVSAKTAS